MRLKKFYILVLAPMVLIGCDGSSADQYQWIVDEYKEVLCIGYDRNASMTAKTEALGRQLQLNEEYKKALASLSLGDQQVLLLAWTKALAEVVDGDCNGGATADGTGNGAKQSSTKAAPSSTPRADILEALAKQMKVSEQSLRSITSEQLEEMPVSKGETLVETSMDDICQAHLDSVNALLAYSDHLRDILKPSEFKEFQRITNPFQAGGSMWIVDRWCANRHLMQVPYDVRDAAGKCHNFAQAALALIEGVDPDN